MKLHAKIFDLALTIRAVEMTLLDGYKDRQFGGTIHTCIGQELTPGSFSIKFGL